MRYSKSTTAVSYTHLDVYKRQVFELAKADKIMFDGDYPGWKPNPDSAILKEMQEIYEQLYGKKPAVMAVHAGLECGILGSKYTLSLIHIFRFPVVNKDGRYSPE